MILEGKVAIVTGAGSGLGKGIALGFAKEGCSVVVCDINGDSVKETKKEIEQFGGKALAITCDVSSPDEAIATVKKTVETYGKIDILANVAGISPKKDGNKIPFYEITPEEWNKVLAVNLSSCLYFGSAVAPYMMKQKSGRIISMASIAGKIGSEWGPAGAHYRASKAGVISLTQCMAFELAPYGITVNAVAPGRIQTPMAVNTSDEANQAMLKLIPMQRFGTIEEVVNVFIFYASDKSSYITGETTDVNGGWLID
ncbi:SDR family NAD(P)-dependent oxidoreductase [Thermoanaerobacteraceae bacterium SP2]|nr:SDR family NAD(P)-dependent oxidoreductase [Thermoanaerobacteraceae bacterium SP2]